MKADVVVQYCGVRFFNDILYVNMLERLTSSARPAFSLCLQNPFLNSTTFWLWVTQTYSPEISVRMSRLRGADVHTEFFLFILSS